MYARTQYYIIQVNLFKYTLYVINIVCHTSRWVEKTLVCRMFERTRMLKLESNST